MANVRIRQELLRLAKTKVDNGMPMKQALAEAREQEKRLRKTERIVGQALRGKS